MQADLNNQLAALEAREAERERNIAQLRAELAQAPPVAAEATALVSRLGTETREKAALEAEMQASRAELAARNQELDTKIQQLGQLIEQLNKTAAPVAAPVGVGEKWPAAAAPLPAAAGVPPVAAAGSRARCQVCGCWCCHPSACGSYGTCPQGLLQRLAAWQSSRPAPGRGAAARPRLQPVVGVGTASPGPRGGRSGRAVLGLGHGASVPEVERLPCLFRKTAAGAMPMPAATPVIEAHSRRPAHLRTGGPWWPKRGPMALWTKQAKK